VVRFLMEKADVVSPELVLPPLPPLPSSKRLRPTVSPIQHSSTNNSGSTQESSSLDSIAESFDESFPSDSSATSSFFRKTSSYSSNPTLSPPLFDPSLTDPISSSSLLQQSSLETSSITSLFDSSIGSSSNSDFFSSESAGFDTWYSNVQDPLSFDDTSQFFTTDSTDTSYLFDSLSTARCSPLSDPIDRSDFSNFLDTSF